MSYFDHFSKAEVDKILNYLEEKSFERNAMIVEQGELVKGMGILITGSCNLYFITPGGQKILIKVISSGDSFAENALLEHHGNPYSVEANEKCIVKIFASKSMDIMRKVHPSLAYKMEELICQHISQNYRVICQACEKILDHMAVEENPIKVDKHFSKTAAMVTTPQALDCSAEILKNYNIFRDFSLQDIEKLMLFVTFLRTSAGQIIYQKKDKGGTCFLVLQGALQTTFDRKSPLAKISVIAPDEFVGLYSIFKKSERMTSCTTPQAAVLMELTNETLSEIKKFDKALWYKTHTLLCRAYTLELYNMFNHFNRITSISVKYLDTQSGQEQVQGILKNLYIG